MWISLGCVAPTFHFGRKGTPNVAEAVSFSKRYFGTDTEK
jgi:hypothetical protein